MSIGVVRNLGSTASIKEFDLNTQPQSFWTASDRTDQVDFYVNPLRSNLRGQDHVQTITSQIFNTEKMTKLQFAVNKNIAGDRITHLIRVKNANGTVITSMTDTLTALSWGGTLTVPENTDVFVEWYMTSNYASRPNFTMQILKLHK